jgi:hypothetical protein
MTSLTLEGVGSASFATKCDLIKIAAQVRNDDFREYLIDQISQSSTQDEVEATSLLIAALVDQAFTGLAS